MDKRYTLRLSFGELTSLESMPPWVGTPSMPQKKHGHRCNRNTTDAIRTPPPLLLCSEFPYVPEMRLLLQPESRRGLQLSSQL